MQLKSMSVKRLSELREKVIATLQTKTAEARTELESRLKELARLDAPRRRGRSGNVAPKYRNPDNHSETGLGAACGRGGLPQRLNVAAVSRIF
jgi:hypothetical protein